MLLLLQSIIGDDSTLTSDGVDRWTTFQMSLRGVWPFIHNVEHSQGAHQDTHGGAAVHLSGGGLSQGLRQRHQLQEPHPNTHRSV